MSNTRRAAIGFAHVHALRRGGVVVPHEDLVHILLIAAFAALLRLPYFGNPAIYIDEQFYMLVADRWLHQGLIPYVDIWDRKPIGIFVIYALGQLFGDPIVGYQVLALLAVIATALCLWAIAALAWSRTVGLFAALLYCAGVMLMDGQGGQTPVYYNALVAGAALLLFAFAVTPERHRRPAGAALTAALLFGLALQVKYAVVFEATALSFWALVALAKLHRWPLPRLAILGGAMASLGLLPTCLVTLAYVAIGHGRDFIFANFLSILAKDSWRQTPDSYLSQFNRCSHAALVVLAPGALGLGGLLVRWHRQPTPERWLAGGLMVWLGATFAGAMLMGKPAEHYFLPTLAPLSLLAGWGIEHVVAVLPHRLPRWPARADASVVFAALLGAATIAAFDTVRDTEDHWGDPVLIRRVAAAIKPRLNGRCLYVFNRLPIYYYLTESCLPTRYPFPNHLNDSAELNALPDDALKEFARVLAEKPVLLVRIPITAETDPAAEEMLNRALVRDYVLDRMVEGVGQTINVYVPRAAAAPPATRGAVAAAGRPPAIARQ